MTTKAKNNQKSNNDNGLKNIGVTIAGVTPLLMHRFTEADGVSVSSSSRSMLVGSRGTPREQAEDFAYKNARGLLIIPARNLFRCLIDAGKFFKLGKSKMTTMKNSIIPAMLSITELECPILVKGRKTKKFEVDRQSVVIPSTGGRIMRYRPCLDEWEISFMIEYDSGEIDDKLIRNLVDAAGSKIGLGDFRPDRKGLYGRFKVVHWTLDN